MTYKWPFAETCDLEGSCGNFGRCDDCRRYWEHRNPRMDYLDDMFEEK